MPPSLCGSVERRVVEILLMHGGILPRKNSVHACKMRQMHLAMLPHMSLVNAEKEITAVLPSSSSVRGPSPPAETLAWADSRRSPLSSPPPCSFRPVVLL